MENGGFWRKRLLREGWCGRRGGVRRPSECRADTGVHWYEEAVPSVSRLSRLRVLFLDVDLQQISMCAHTKKMLAFFGAMMLSAGCADAAGMCVLAAAW